MGTTIFLRDITRGQKTGTYDKSFSPWRVRNGIPLNIQELQEQQKKALQKLLKELFTKPPFNDVVTGNKTLDVIYSTENEPNTPHIRLHRLGNREPWCMSDGDISFDEHELTFMLDVRVSETDQQAPDKNVSHNVSITNQGKKTKLGDNGDISDDICDCLTEIFKYNGHWKESLSSVGIHNARLIDERETYNGGEYLNPLRLVFNAYVQT